MAPWGEPKLTHKNSDKKNRAGSLSKTGDEKITHIRLRFTGSEFQPEMVLFLKNSGEVWSWPPSNYQESALAKLGAHITDS